jgi:type II restriction enzyme
MAEKHRLRKNRYGTVINATSTKQELALADALVITSEAITERFGLALRHDKRVMLKDVVEQLREQFPTVDFGDPLPNTYMSPDGGILSIVSNDEGLAFPILITEVKNQGTNDLRAAEEAGNGKRD